MPTSMTSAPSPGTDRRSLADRPRSGSPAARVDELDLDIEDMEDVDEAEDMGIEEEDDRRDLRAEPARVAEEEIDPELEQEIRKEIEEIEELEREMGLRGPVEARPGRGDDLGGRPLRTGTRHGQAADPGDLPPRRRGAGSGDQGKHWNQGTDPLHLHQHSRPLPGA